MTAIKRKLREVIKHYMQHGMLRHDQLWEYFRKGLLTKKEVQRQIRAERLSVKHNKFVRGLITKPRFKTYYDESVTYYG